MIGTAPEWIIGCGFGYVGYGDGDGSGYGYGDGDGDCSMWPISPTDKIISIGCQTMPLDEWLGPKGEAMAAEYEAPIDYVIHMRAWLESLQ